jgi:pimeloyl-ACP methyl ester carboxylesterase
MRPYGERRYRSRDELLLYFRDYDGPHSVARTPVLCIPGLTRNARDFEAIAAHIAATRRVLVADLRGRGRSDYDPNPANYAVPVETSDMLDLLAFAEIPRVVVLGTSRGGVIAMVMATVRPEALAGAILNDMGAELEPRGLERIYAIMRAPPSYPGWDEATEWLKQTHAAAFPNVSDARWSEFARALYCERKGRVVGDYDPEFPRAVLNGRGTNPRDEKGAADLWKWFGALRPIPALVLRGQNSDLLTEATVKKMQAAKPDLVAVTIANRGHVPFLDEPAAVGAIDRFLAGIP